MTKENSSKSNIFILLIFISLAFLLSFFVFKYVKHEQFVYFWDYSNYFNKYLYIDKIFSGNNIIKTILDSIKYDDYNLVAVLPLLITRWLFGNNRFGYIESIYILYLVPSIFFTYLWISRYLRYKTYSISKIWILVFVFAVIPPVFYGPALRGYLDIVVMIPIVLILMTTLKIFKGSDNLLDYLLIGSMIFTGSLLRRWFVYFSVSYLILLLAVFLIKIAIDTNKIKKHLNLLIWMFNTLLILIYVFKPEFIYRVDTGFIGSLLAYKVPMNTLQKDWEQILGFGFYYFMPLILGIMEVFYDFKKSLYELFLLLILFITYFLFTNTQDLGDHHVYIILPVIILFSFIGIYKIFATTQNKYIKASYVLGLVSVQILIYLFTFNPNYQSLKVKYIFPDTTYYPLVRSDLGEMDNLIKTINSERNGEEKIYVLASSWTLNDDVIANRSREIGLEGFANNIMYTADVDKRDGFPEYFFDAKYIITSSGTEIHLEANEQRNLYILHDFVESNPEYYIKIGDCFQLENNVCGEIYRLEKDIPVDEIKNLKRSL